MYLRSHILFHLGISSQRRPNCRPDGAGSPKWKAEYHRRLRRLGNIKGNKLFNVAKASFDELLADYEDYMRVRGIGLWPEAKQREVREFCRNHNDSTLYREIAPKRDDATLANLCLTLIHQELFLLIRLIERAKSDFLKQGGIREEMTRARLAYRNQHSHGSYGNYGNRGNYGSPNNPNNPNSPNRPRLYPFISHMNT